MRPEPPVFKLLPQRAGFRLAKKLVVFDVAPANRDLVELVPLAPVGVDRPELPSDVALEKRSCITDDDRLLSESCLVLRFEVAALLGGRFRFNTSVKRSCDGLGDRVSSPTIPMSGC